MTTSTPGLLRLKRLGKRPPPASPPAPSPRTVRPRSSGTWRRGGRRSGGRGSKAPPTPRNTLPSPCTKARDASPRGRRGRGRGGGRMAVAVFPRPASRRLVLLALAGLLVGACARESSIGATTEGSVSLPLASATPLLPLSPTVQPTPSARVLTEAGCCARHWWSSDGSRVLYIDDPPGNSPLGIYAAPTVGGEVSLVSTSVSGEDLSPEDAPPELMGAFDRGDPAFRLPADADNVRLSPDGTAWPGRSAAACRSTSIGVNAPCGSWAGPRSSAGGWRS